jgi:RNA recognition motif-containing protein
MIRCSATAEENKMKNIFVGNLSFGATEDAIRSMFEAYGTVDRVSVVTDRDTGQARGFGFVELNGRELDGRALNVNEARPKEDRGFGGGGGGRGKGGGGGFGGQRRNNRY